MTGFVPENITVEADHPLARYVAMELKKRHPTLTFITSVFYAELDDWQVVNEFNTWIKNTPIINGLYLASGVTFGHVGFRTDYKLFIYLKHGGPHSSSLNIMPLMGGPEGVTTSEICEAQRILQQARLPYVFSGWDHCWNNVDPYVDYHGFRSGISNPINEEFLKNSVAVHSDVKVVDGIKYNSALKSYIKYVDGVDVAHFDLELGGCFGSMTKQGFTQEELIAILAHLGDSSPIRKYPVYTHTKTGVKYAILSVGETKDGNTGESIVHYANVDTGQKYMHLYHEFFKQNEDGSERFQKTDDMIELSEE